MAASHFSDNPRMPPPAMSWSLPSMAASSHQLRQSHVMQMRHHALLNSWPSLRVSTISAHEATDAVTCRRRLPMKLLELGLSAQLPGRGGRQEAVRSFHDPQTQALSREVASAIIGFDTRRHTTPHACLGRQAWQHA